MINLWVTIIPHSFIQILQRGTLHREQFCQILVFAASEVVAHKIHQVSQRNRTLPLMQMLWKRCFSMASLVLVTVKVVAFLTFDGYLPQLAVGMTSSGRMQSSPRLKHLICIIQCLILMVFDCFRTTKSFDSSKCNRIHTTHIYLPGHIISSDETPSDSIDGSEVTTNHDDYLYRTKNHLHIPLHQSTKSKHIKSRGIMWSRCMSQSRDTRALLKCHQFCRDSYYVNV
jgi:hypothetical protein